MAQYSVKCINNSQISGSFMLFQAVPKIGMPANVFSLAWFARPTAPGSQVNFVWSTDYSFVWAETGVLQPGINFSAEQIINADPDGQNSVELTTNTDGATALTNLNSNGAVGSLTIPQLSNVTTDSVSVGIGMSGSGTFVVQAAPNVTSVFTPNPSYWVAFGNYQTGDVLSSQDTIGAVEVAFGGSLTARTAVLGLDNIITVQS